jgi:hypothetical protein
MTVLLGRGVMSRKAWRSSSDAISRYSRASQWLKIEHFVTAITSAEAMGLAY